MRDKQTEAERESESERERERETETETQRETERERVCGVSSCYLTKCFALLLASRFFHVVIAMSAPCLLYTF